MLAEMAMQIEMARYMTYKSAYWVCFVRDFQNFHFISGRHRPARLFLRFHRQTLRERHCQHGCHKLCSGIANSHFSCLNLLYI